ncbi:1-aminocyclopropane-1-carboxylate deaminase/D-cysteine desulfhydrase [Kangiella sediminilitoris]|uniref:Pyridoxal-5'-phosphate-dependent enzyme, beta subunit n=1 Tax=Kangiella sediminilitoris TaxID=1144748 RepID=A0A1B3B8U1_9GAMM|nr:pyridoxal-phosphate dependent enzyme [Kangiella sediminilitoris]AOE49217.1 Pyridoxal-5'-phosphate-dependent enzyme, beta subunit [Kangiella sediminilitoris]
MVRLSDSPIQPVTWSQAEKYGVTIDIKRDDLIHPIVTGNKWRKLKYLLMDAQNKKCRQIVSMGGNWSNHLHALAFAGNSLGIKTRAFVRAHQNQALTPTLRDCQRWGMTLQFCTRSDYELLRKDSHWARWQNRFPDSYWIGEGGFSELAIQGVSDMSREVQEAYDYIFTGCGSGATLCGLARAFPETRIVGVAAFSGAEYLKSEIQAYLGKLTNWFLDTKHHCGGFAKSSELLLKLQSELESKNEFRLDTVYNTKTFLALNSWIEEGYITKSNKVLVIHTGGLQGERVTPTDK